MTKRTKVTFALVSRTTKSNAGRTNIIEQSNFNADGSCDERVVGFYTRPFKGDFDSYATIDGNDVHVGVFKTRSQAGHRVRTAYLDATESEKTVGTLSLEDAANTLCGEAKNPLQALKRRISRGTIETVELNGETRVVMPQA